MFSTCNDFCKPDYLKSKCDNKPWWCTVEEPEYFIERSISKDCADCLKASLEFFKFDPRTYSDFSGQNVFHLCAIWDAKKCLKYLAEDLGLMDLVDKPSAFNTPLMMALEKYHSLNDKICKMFLQYGADLNKKDRDGRTPQDIIDLRKKIAEKSWGSYKM